MLKKFIVQNLGDKLMALAVEPWAQTIELSPLQIAEFRYDDPAEIEFAPISDSEAMVAILCEAVSVSVSGVVVYSYP